VTATAPCGAPGCAELVAALLDGDANRASEVIDGLLEGGADPRAIATDVLGPALTVIGNLWASGEISVAQEHLASAIVMAVYDHPARLLPQAPTGDRLVVLAGTPGELHVIGLRMVADFLRADGWRVLPLGAATPADDLVAFVAERHPDVVGLSTALTTHLRDVQEIVAALRALPRPPVVIVGGAAYADDPALAEGVGADLYAGDARMASEALQPLLARD
jgi:MerR family transcriptional regulator, light-induced transcriptional regulator